MSTYNSIEEEHRCYVVIEAVWNDLYPNRSPDFYIRGIYTGTRQVLAAVKELEIECSKSKHERGVHRTFHHRMIDTNVPVKHRVGF